MKITVLKRILVRERKDGMVAKGENNLGDPGRDVDTGKEPVVRKAKDVTEYGNKWVKCCRCQEGIGLWIHKER